MAEPGNIVPPLVAFQTIGGGIAVALSVEAWKRKSWPAGLVAVLLGSIAVFAQQIASYSPAVGDFLAGIGGSPSTYWTVFVALLAVWAARRGASKASGGDIGHLPAHGAGREIKSASFPHQEIEGKIAELSRQCALLLTLEPHVRAERAKKAKEKIDALRRELDGLLKAHTAAYKERQPVEGSAIGWAADRQKLTLRLERMQEEVRSIVGVEVNLLQIGETEPAPEVELVDPEYQRAYRRSYAMGWEASRTLLSISHKLERKSEDAENQSGPPLLQKDELGPKAGYSQHHSGSGDNKMDFRG